MNRHIFRGCNVESDGLALGRCILPYSIGHVYCADAEVLVSREGETASSADVATQESESRITFVFCLPHILCLQFNPWTFITP